MSNWFAMKTAPAPALDAHFFRCPNCGLGTQQEWHPLSPGANRPDPHIKRATCVICKEFSYFVDGTLAWPAERIGDEPSEDLTDQEREIYEEARSIAVLSPRAACALLRLVLDTVLKAEGHKGKDLYHRIEAAASAGAISRQMIDAYDNIRHTGNDAAHDDEFSIDLADGPEELEIHFAVLNLAVNNLRALPRISRERNDERAARVQQRKDAGQTSNP